MQFLTKLAAYGQAMSRKQIAIVCGLVATASIGGYVLADYLTAPVGDALSDQVGAIQADFKVTESGAATYNIKIYTPPGTAGVAPQVSLVYSSQGGNGVMGKGWSISGTSGISRCRASREAGDSNPGGVPGDVDAGPVNFSSSDKFCLDGQRLLDVTGKTDNPTLTNSCKVVAGALKVMSLRTEIESFQRVCAYIFNEANGPRFFTVERKDGSISWYGDRVTNSTGEIGARTDGFLESNRQLTDGTYTNNSMISSWLQTRFQDSTGNYIDYLYLKNPTQGVSANVTGELVLSEIKYTGKVVLPGQSGSAVAPYASIKFNYGLASQVTTGYQSGSRFTQSQILNSVTVTNDGEVVRHYPLTYVTSASGSGATLLSQVKECADVAAVTCLQPTVFNWSAAVSSLATEEMGANDYTGDTWYVSYDGHYFGQLIDMKWGDIDGDGLQDMVSIYKNSGGSTTQLFTHRTIPKTSGVINFVGGGSWTLGGDYQVPPYYTENGAKGAGWFLVDYNGDGFDDLALSTGTTTGDWVIRPSRGGSNGFDSSVNLLAGLASPIPANQNMDLQPKLADLNGDGLTDIIYYKNSTIKARLMEKQNGTYGWYTERTLSSDICTGIKSCAYAFNGLFRKRGFQQLYDFNGDSRSDLILYANVTAARDTSLFDSQGDISTPPKPGVSPFPSTKKVSFALTVDSITSTEIKLKRYSWWDSSAGGLDDWINFADINGDGASDLVQNNSNIVRYQINNGMGFRPSKTMSGSIVFNSKLQVLDVNGDGRADLVYPDNSVSRFKTRLADINGDFGAESEIPGGNAKTNCIGSAISECLNSHIYTFMDLDGDGNLDFLRMRIKPTNGLEANVAQTFISRSASASRNTPRDTIAEIQDGLGAKIKVEYLPLTNKDVYRRQNGARNGLNFGRSSPTQDFMAAMYVVASVSTSAPTATNPAAMQSVGYRYAEAKLQAGGRGLLGFREITTFDSNFLGYTIATTTNYFQDFPFTGMPEIITKRLIPGVAYNPNGCLSSANAFCYSNIGDTFPALGGTILSQSGFAYESYPTFAPGVQLPTQIRTIGTETQNYDLNNGQRLSRVATAYYYDAWGNTVQTAVDTNTGADNANPVRLETTSTYANDAVNWRLSRMTQSIVTHRRNGQATYRTTSFDYDMAGPATGFLKSERISPNGLVNQDMRKEYNFDAYGNRIASFSCSQGVVNCKSTTLQYSPWDVTQVHRYSRVEYDSRGRYITGTFEPFNTPGQLWDSTILTERKTQTVLARDKYGEITHAKDVNGVSVVSQRSPMGRDYWSWVQTTPNATPGDPAQGIDSYKTYRYCGATANQVLCPVAAKFREQVITDAAPKHWTYFDSLKRPVMEITQTFNEGQNGKDFSAVCKSYDASGRPSFVSDPFFLSEAAFNGEPSFGTSDPCVGRAGSTTVYDIAGRPTFITMSDGSKTTSTYDGLTTTTKRTITTDVNSPTQKKVEVKNALGELVKTIDNADFQTEYSYDAAGNLATVKRNAGRGDIVTSMSYDSIGRKTYMKDPDAGEWWYNYYPSGELATQYNQSEMIYRESRYDYRGRLVWSGTQNRTGVWESVNVSSYDTATNGIGQLNCTWEDGFQYRVWQGDTSKSNSWTKCQQYDSMGRTTTTTTTIDGNAYYEVVRYDGLSRAYKSMDPSGQWTKTEFTPRGFSVRTCESSDADTNASCASNVATTYLETLETDQRGHVVREKRGGTDAMLVTRTYDPYSGALLRTCSGNSCQIADENLEWDIVGNLKSRDMKNEYREEYSYDGLNRLTESHFAKLQTTDYSNGSGPISSKQTYDALGNLCSKTVLGYENIYNYGGASGCGLNGAPGSGQNNSIVSPHAVQLVTDVNSGANTIYIYDSHGNQIAGDRDGTSSDRSIEYTGNDQAYQIVEGRNTAQLWYTPGNQRYKRIDTFYGTVSQTQNLPTKKTLDFAENGKAALLSGWELATNRPVSTSTTKASGLVPYVTKTITVANLEIITDPNGVVTQRRTVAGVMLQETINNVSVNRYLFHNHLGSVIRIAEANGAVTEKFDYSPFGERRMPTAYNPNGVGFGTASTKRGYTGHEMLDAFSIVHMNGRIYDSGLGRFLQADPMVQDPSNGQNFNRYTYVWNNPLAYTDPSGFISVGGLVRQLIGVFISSYLPGASFWGAAANGALANISAGFIGGVVATGNLRGGLAGAFSSGVMYAGRPGEVEEAVVPVQGNHSDIPGERTQVFGATISTRSETHFADCKASNSASLSTATVDDQLSKDIWAVTKEVMRFKSKPGESIDSVLWRIHDYIEILTAGTGYEFASATSVKSSSEGDIYGVIISTSSSPFFSAPKFNSFGKGWTFRPDLTEHSHGFLSEKYRLNDRDYRYIRANEDPKDPFIMKVGQVAYTVPGLGTDRGTFSDQDKSNGQSMLVNDGALLYGYYNQGCVWTVDEMTRPSNVK